MTALTKTAIRRTWPRGDPLREVWERHWAAVKAAGFKVRRLDGRPNYLGGMTFVRACKPIVEARDASR